MSEVRGPGGYIYEVESSANLSGFFDVNMDIDKIPTVPLDSGTEVVRPESVEESDGDLPGWFTQTTR